MDNMDRFFVLGKLQFGGEIKNRGRIFAKKINIRFNEITTEGVNEFKNENPVFILYKNISELR